MCGDDELMLMDVDATAAAAIQSIYHGRHFTVPLPIWLAVRSQVVAQVETWRKSGKAFAASLGHAAIAKHDRVYAQRGTRTDGPVTPCKGPGMIGAV